MHINAVFKTYAPAIILSLGALILVGVSLGTAALVTALILAVLEISLSFDNAVVNAKLLRDMSPVWRKLFLTVGILVAVVGVRAILPVLLVAIVADRSLADMTQLILHDPAAYGALLQQIHPEIAAFGGIFLLLLFLDYILEDKPVVWLRRIERPLIKLGQIERIEVVIALIVLIVASAAAPAEHHASMLVSGVVGLTLYLSVKGVSDFFRQRQLALRAASAGLISFVYLEILDASFSLDGVLGAFAITSNPLVIMAGLGIGALWVRSITMHFLYSDTLNRFSFIEHGAHYAIGVLAVLLLASASFEISEIAVGLIGLVILSLAVKDSILRNRKK